MTEHNDSGFTFIETLAAVALMLIISSAIAGLFITASRSNQAALSSLKETYTLLNCDRKIRKHIAPISLPYWKNSLSATYIICDSIIYDLTIPGVVLISASPLIQNGAAHGISVTYRLLPHAKEYTCAVLFSSAGDGVFR
jgi:prepilin-type N-terminal cleavage/methylation domain-containing protein